jgi:hypothetical protein
MSEGSGGDPRESDRFDWGRGGARAPKAQGLADPAYPAAGPGPGMAPSQPPAPPQAQPQRWDQPPTGYPQYPGYAQYPAQQSGSPYWPAWPPPPQPISKAGRNGCLLGCGIAMAAFALLVVGVIALTATILFPAISTSQQITDASGGQVRYTSYSWYNGVGEFSVFLAQDVPDSAGAQVACQVVRPTVRGTRFEGDHFAVYNNDGYLVADWRTPCG